MYCIYTHSLQIRLLQELKADAESLLRQRPAANCAVQCSAVQEGWETALQVLTCTVSSDLDVKMQL